MKVKIHRGTHQIGGCITEIESNNGTKIIIDIGENLPSQGSDKKEEIKQKIRSMGYANKLIKYEDFLKLYEPYKNEISENDFAQIIGIATVNLNSLRLGKFRARVLKSSPIELMKNCIECGMGKDETIKYCMKECGLSKEELLKEMENYQREENLKRNKSKESR